MKYSFLFYLIISLYSCKELSSFYYQESEYTDFLLDENFLSISFSSDSLIADGVSSIDIYIEIPKESKDDIASVFLSTNNGSFINGKDTISVIFGKIVEGNSVRKVAKTKLVSSIKLEDANIIAKIGYYSKNKFVLFKRSCPSTITLELSSLDIVYGFQMVTATTILHSEKGKVTNNTNAELIAVDSAGNPIGYFQNYHNESDSNGLIINHFVLGTDSCFCNRVYLIASTFNASSDTSFLIIH